MPALNTLRILWTALAASSLAFLFVLLKLRPEPAGPPPALFVPVFALIALGTIIASFVIPRIGYKTAAIHARADITEAVDQSGSDVLPDREAPRRRVFAKPAKARRTAAMIFQTPFILGMALTNAVILFGFALGWLGHSMAVWAPFFVVGWLLYALRFPTENAVFGRFAKAKDAAFPD